ncbi:MAG: acyltransferase family protein [Nocardioides sp.]
MLLRFRADIQGLRALAVLLVALAHAHVGPLQGGFVGVDVFFVISGFLITTLLVEEAERDRHVSLLGFYARRARRILPAATLVVVVTVAASLVVLSAVEARSAIEDALWATFFAANVKFAADGTDYFNAEAAPSPLQHYWSLAVEEQFYLVWPLLVLLLCVLARRRATPRDAHVRDTAVPVLGLVIAASFAFSVLYTSQHTVEAYFSPFTRAWELALGALAAVLAPRVARLPATVLGVVSWLGLGAVAVAALTFDSATVFPGYAAALPVVGSAMLLLGGLRPAPWGPQRGFGWRPVRTLGDWSYSLYLWHWPLLILAGSLWGRPHGLSGLAVLVVATAVSGLTYHFVENPFRRAKVITARRIRGVLLYPAVVVLTLPLLAAANGVVEHEVGQGGAAISLTHYGQRPGEPRPHFSKDPVVALVQASVLAAHHHVRVPADLHPSLLDLDADRPDIAPCEYFEINSDRPLCPRGDTGADRSLVLIGDSHARQWIPALDTLAERYGYTAYFLVREGCPSTDVTPWLTDGTGPSTDCQNFQDWAAQQVQRLHPAVVLMAGEANPGGFADDQGNHVTDEDQVARLVEQGMERQVARISPYTARTIIIGDPPALQLSPGRCLSGRGASLQKCMTHGDPTSIRMADSLRRAARATGTPYVETGQWFCFHDECPTVIGDYIARRDRAHISVSYAGYLTDALESRIHLDR